MFTKEEKRCWSGQRLLLYSSSSTRDKVEAPHPEDLVRQVQLPPTNTSLEFLAPGCGATHDDTFLLAPPIRN